MPSNDTWERMRLFSWEEGGELYNASSAEVASLMCISANGYLFQSVSKLVF